MKKSKLLPYSGIDYTQVHMKWNRIFRFFLISIGLVLAFFAVVNLYIVFIAKWFHTGIVSDVPYRSAWLLLGTAKTLENGKPNAFYDGRIQAMADLYAAKKIDCVLISGDNTSKEYNEPKMIQNSLLEKGIPGNRMYLDYAGIRTLDSLLRARDIFGLTSFTIVSQPFHTERALFLARYFGLTEVSAFDAPTVPFFAALGVYVREFFSRPLALWDVLANTPSKISGESIHIEYNSLVRPVPEKICTPRDL